MQKNPFLSYWKTPKIPKVAISAENPPRIKAKVQMCLATKARPEVSILRQKKGRWIDWLIDWFGWLIDLVDWLIDWFGWLIDWFGWFDWLIDLVDCFGWFLVQSEKNDLLFFSFLGSEPLTKNQQLIWSF